MSECNRCGGEHFEICATLVDTWGKPCGSPECEEEFRTTGIEIFAGDEPGFGEFVVIALCERHLADFIRDVIFERRFVAQVEIE